MDVKVNQITALDNGVAQDQGVNRLPGNDDSTEVRTGTDNTRHRILGSTGAFEMTYAMVKKGEGYFKEFIPVQLIAQPQSNHVICMLQTNDVKMMFCQVCGIKDLCGRYAVKRYQDGCAGKPEVFN